MNLTTPLIQAGPHSVWDWEPYPDVVWGPGGIDDWGWTAHEPRSSNQRPTAPSSNPSKGADLSCLKVSSPANPRRSPGPTKP